MTGEGRDPDRVPMRDAAPSLPPAALRGVSRVLDPPVAVTVWLWRPRVGWAELAGQATAYTDVAGYIRYVDEHGRSDAVWVWANAIRRR